MTSKRNLGPILAIAGGIVAVLAVIAGFIVIGGPGDARDRRLDEMTMGRVTNVLNVVQCAFNQTGTVPATIDDARKVVFKSANIKATYPCTYDATAEQTPVSAGSAPAKPGDVSFESTSGNHVRICGNFRRAETPEACADGCYRGGFTGAYPQFSATRPAGVHCYDVDLVRVSDDAASPTSHAGHMDVFE